MFMMRSELGSFTLKRLFSSANRRFLNKAMVAARGLNELFKMFVYERSCPVCKVYWVAMCQADGSPKFVYPLGLFEIHTTFKP